MIEAEGLVKKYGDFTAETAQALGTATILYRRYRGRAAS